MWSYPGRSRFFIRAIRNEKPHPALTEFRLCKELGISPTELAKQPARTIHQFLLVIAEMDKIVNEEKEKAEREAKKVKRPRAFR